MDGWVRVEVDGEAQGALGERSGSGKLVVTT
jgi:hypothetical protein